MFCLGLVYTTKLKGNRLKPIKGLIQNNYIHLEYLKSNSNVIKLIEK